MSRNSGLRCIITARDKVSKREASWFAPKQTAEEDGSNKRTWRGIITRNISHYDKSRNLNSPHRFKGIITHPWLIYCGSGQTSGGQWTVIKCAIKYVFHIVRKSFYSNVRTDSFCTFFEYLINIIVTWSRTIIRSARRMHRTIPDGRKAQIVVNVCGRGHNK